MGYTGPYSLATRCLTEFLGTFCGIGFGLGIVANELLPSTKGHAIGFAFVALGFGMSFTFAIEMFGYASAHINPAMCISLWVRGKLSFTDFLALSAAELAGGFCAALFIYLVYLPHFRTVPESYAASLEDNLLRTRDHIDPSALRFASYSTKPQYSTKPTTAGQKSLAQRISDARYYLLGAQFDENPEGVIEHLIGGTYALHEAEMPFPNGTESLGGRNTPMESGGNVAFLPGKNQLKRRHSLQVADMQRLLRKMERELGQKDSSEDQSYIDGNKTAGDLAVTAKAAASGVSIDGQQHVAFRNSLDSSTKTGIRAKLSREDALGRAAVAADQATKLSVFATRPAIFLPVHNFLVEMLGTAALIFGASMIDARFEMIEDSAIQNGAAISMQPFLIGMWIFVLVVSLGGPTGFAANPARDFMPRMAHLVLAIPGKGSSEVWYGVIINIASLLGGVIGGALFMAADSINKY